MPTLEPAVLISQAELQDRVRQLADQITADYTGRGELVLVAVLKGAFVFLADLSRAISLPHLVDFIAVSSYGSATRSGEVRLIMDARMSLAGRHVILVDDILDTGHTLHYLVELLRARGPATLATAVLLHKPDRLEAEIAVDYQGFVIPNVWVVGYGLDLAERHRSLPYIGQLTDAEAEAITASAGSAPTGDREGM